MTSHRRRISESKSDRVCEAQYQVLMSMIVGTGHLGVTTPSSLESERLDFTKPTCKLHLASLKHSQMP